MQDSIDELLLARDARPGVVRLAVTLAMDRKASAREWTSQLISELTARKVLSPSDVERGFFSLLNIDLPDLILDYPNAPEIVGNFMARAVADEALKGEFLFSSTSKPSESQAEQKTQGPWTNEHAV